MRDKKVLGLIIGGILVLVGATLSLTYAFLSVSKKQDLANVFTSGCLNITIENESNAISLTNAFPITDIEGLENEGYTFTIRNTCNTSTNYMINLESLNQTTNTLDTEYLKTSLSSDTMDNLIQKLDSNMVTKAYIENAYVSHNLYKGIINGNSTKTFNLKLWMDYDTTKEQGASKTYTSKINVIANPDIEVISTPEIKTKLVGNILIGKTTDSKNVNIGMANIINDETYPFVYNEFGMYTSTNKEDDTTSTITFNVAENINNAGICYNVSSEENYDEAIFYVDNEEKGRISGEESNCISLGNITLNNKIKVEYSKDDGGSGGDDEVSFYFSTLESISDLNLKYCMSADNICIPNTDSNLNSRMFNIDLNNLNRVRKNIVCIQMINGLINCSNPISEVKTALMVSTITGDGESENFLGSDKTRADFESITTLDKINIPEEATSWDVSNNNSSEVMAWYLDEDNNGKYELYIAQDGGVVANKNSSNLFRYFSNVTSIDLSNFNTSNVTDMTDMFSGLDSLTSLDLSNFNTSKVTRMNSMFSRMSGYNNKGGLISLDLSSFDTSNVTDMAGMFSGLDSLTSLDISNFNTSNVTNMFYMFQGMSSLTSLDVSNFDTSNVTNMSGMFENMQSLTSLDVSNFDTSNATNMGGMFQNMQSLTSLDVSNFDTSNATNIGGMFSGMNSLASLDISNFNTSNATNMWRLFAFMRNLTSLNLGDFDTSKVTNGNEMFYSTSKLSKITVKNASAKTFIEERLTDAKLSATVTIAT